ncbi:MAG: tripartite tricarboxylate transporter TctB family protein [Hyphomicrobiaceae bacterium]|nr:tripartite tricarboxylate transporter TctB family protein [Hyphomicrobiaceae bacterium]
MSNEHQPTPAGDAGTAIVAASMVIFGTLAITDTYEYFDFDSAVFPRTIAAALVLLALVILLQWVAQRTGVSTGAETGEPVESGGSWPRRIALVAAMLGAALAMPWIGFQVTALIAFAVLLVVAMHDPWTPARLIVYPAVGLAIVMGFYFLFAKLLMVPLPVGRWFA